MLFECKRRRSIKIDEYQYISDSEVPTGHPAWYTGVLSQLPVVEMSWGKKSKKKPSVLTNFCFLVNFIRHTGPMVTLCPPCATVG